MISIDSNIVRRLIENNNEVISKINELRKSYLKIAINIDSFFEILDQCEKGCFSLKEMIYIMMKYEINIAPNSLFPTETNDLNKIKISDENYIYLAKKVIIPSFSHIISIFVSNYYKAFLVFLLISTKQKNEMLAEYCKKYTHKDVFGKKINKNIFESYIENKYKLVDIIENDLYDIAKNILVNTGIKFTASHSYKELFDKIKNNVKYDDYYDVIIECDNSIDEVEYEFMINYAYDLILSGKKLDLNDIVDFFNVFSSYKSNVKYITCDNKGFKLWKKIMKNEKFLKYLDEDVIIIKV